MDFLTGILRILARPLQIFLQIFARQPIYLQLRGSTTELTAQYYALDRECIEVVTDGENALFVPGSDINQALCLFYKRKIPGWINYRDDYVTRGICKRGEFYAQVDAEKPEPSGQHAAV